jgi:hypothetical protein
VKIFCKGNAPIFGGLFCRLILEEDLEEVRELLQNKIEVSLDFFQYTQSLVCAFS